MKKLLPLSTLLLLLSSPLALFSTKVSAQEKPKTLDELLSQVKKERIDKRKELNEREQKFINEKNKQESALRAKREELRKIEAITAQLQGKFQKNDKALGLLEDKLTIAKGNLGEMFGVVKQVAGDFKGQFQNSNISAQFPGRDKFMARLAESKKLPTARDLERLFYEIQKELTESGKIAQFKAQVITPDGKKSNELVTRIGAFNLVSQGQYLTYQSATNQILELPRQPEGKYLGLIDDLEKNKKGYSPFGVDPSRGTILGMLVQAPSLGERIQQGGIIGYIILVLLALGLVLGVERMVVLNKEGKKIKEQLDNPELADASNPVGRLIRTFNENHENDIESLELKLDETILKTAPQLERGIPTIKILYAVAPLMGLLGTVTGMIGTFQSITLFGTGDPKLMAGGISTALVTTVLGLVCAIPLLFVHSVVHSRAKDLLQILEEQAAGLLSKKAEKQG